MGCCASTPRPSTPPPTTQQARPHSSTSQQPLTAVGTATGIVATGGGYGPPPQRALSQVFNAPLKPHFWSPKDRQWTQTMLDRERQVFWDTAITNRAEIWASLHLVCDELVTIPAATVRIWTRLENRPAQDGSSESEGLQLLRDQVREMQEKLSNAQAIIDAAGITLPTGDLCDGAYDTFGNHYTLPAWVCCNPETLLTSSASENDGIKPVLLATDGTDGTDELDEVDDIDVLKGKGKDGVLEGIRELEKKDPKVEYVTVKCRLTDGRRDVSVKVEKGAKVKVLTERVAEIAEAKVRLVYLGKMLDKNVPLVEQGWQEGNVVQALVFPSK